MDTNEQSLYWRYTPNQVVAYNLARAREARGWSQEEAGRRLEAHLGTAWSKATFSQAERSIDPGRSRGFTADEIVAFSRCFGFPVTWFFLPPPPGTAGVPHRAETGETARQYGRRLNALLTQIFGTIEQVDDIQARVGDFAAELNPTSLADAHDVVAETSGAMVTDGPSAAAELRRWRDALQKVAEGLGAIEARVEARLSAEREASIAQEPDFDLRTIELPLDKSERQARRRRGAETEIDLP